MPEDTRSTLPPGPADSRALELSRKLGQIPKPAGTSGLIRALAEGLQASKQERPK